MRAGASLAIARVTWVAWEQPWLRLKRRFAYELKHRWEGYYVVLQARAEPAAMEELHRVLSLADEVIRHKVLRIPEEVYGKLAGASVTEA